MENLKIIKVTRYDIAQLQKIARDTFSETFSSVNSDEDMKRYLADSFSTSKLSEELNHQDSQFYFAVLEDDIIGYLKINMGQAQTELKDNRALEIERIYVLNAYHGKKIGQLLYEKAVNIAMEIQASYVWLGVWEKNDKAIAFYTKNGFVPFDQHVFQLGSDKQIDIMMKKTL